MTLCSGWVIPLVLVTTLAAATSAYESVKQKFAAIEGDQLPPGSRVTLSQRELNAWVAQAVPEGVRNPHVEIAAPDTVTGSAMVDIGKIRRAEGHPPGWLMAQLLDGEHPVRVTVRLTSADGQAQVEVQSVSIAGLQIDGPTLDFLIRNVLLPLYPDAAVGRPFGLSHRIERLEVTAGAVGVVIGRETGFLPRH